jgi:hypothetical protein
LTNPAFSCLIRLPSRIVGRRGEKGRISMDRVLRAGVAGLCLVGAAIAAYASETITYSYDSRGRLIKVERKGSVNNEVKAEYRYDKADNRTNVNVVSPNLP